MLLKSHVWSRLITLGVWCLLVLSLAWWARQWVQAPGDATSALSSPNPLLPTPAVDPKQVARFLGAPDESLNTATAEVAEATPALTQRVRVTGVASSESGEGLALLAVDGNPPRPYARGTAVLPDWVLRSVGSKSLELAHVSNGQQVSLAVPPRSPGR